MLAKNLSLGTETVSRADVHVHSKYSDRPSEWLLRRIGSPESFTEPLDIYRACRQRGMDFVTISDHNCIDAALEIAHLPGTFLASELTTYFPENGCKVHVLVLGVSEQQFQDLQVVRQSIYDLQRYTIDNDIICSCAHPLFRVNDRLTVEQLEKLLLLFNRFEGINGTRDPRAAELVRAIFRQLTPEMIADMADRHGIKPLGAEPWKKTFTGGSDDHGGIYIASAWTETPRAMSVDEYLDHIRHGRQEMGGASGTSLRLAHSFYQIAYSYYKTRLLDESGMRPNLIGELFRRLLERPEPANQASMVPDKVRSLAGKLLLARRSRNLSPVEQTLVAEFSDLFGKRENGREAPQHAPDEADDQRSFQIACDISQQLGYAFVKKFLKYMVEGRLLESLQTLSSLGPVALSIAPYLAAFHTQHKDERFLQAVASRFPKAAGQRLKSDKRAWITDTYTDVNGVVRTIRTLAKVAKLNDKPLTVVTCLENPACDDEIELRNFRPVGTFDVPEYESQQLAVPPFLEVIEYFERERFSELVISTPGPLGLTALAAGRLLGLRVSGMYHTDFPRYVRHLTQDDSLEKLTVWLMQWFYGQMDKVFVPSEFYRRQLVENGFKASQLRVLEHGVDLAQFHPGQRRADYWQLYGLRPGFNFIYVGRVSREKNLEMLMDAFQATRAALGDVNLIVVGEGPLLPALRERYRNERVAFTGWLNGDALAGAYASADAFVFPSTTDTFGNAVLEAQACGLPAIVSHRGGPQGIVRRFDSGLVVNTSQPAALADAMIALARSSDLAELRERALLNARSSSWQTVFDQFWNDQPTSGEDADSDSLPSDEEHDGVPMALDLA